MSSMYENIPEDNKPAQPLRGRLIIQVDEDVMPGHTATRMLDIDLNELGFKAAMFQSILTWNWRVVDPEDGTVTEGWANLRVTRQSEDEVERLHGN